VLPCLQEGKDSLNLPHRPQRFFSLNFIENQGADMGVCLTKVAHAPPPPTLRPPRTQQPSRVVDRKPVPSPKTLSTKVTVTGHVTDHRSLTGHLTGHVTGQMR
jgi:hypothetical protein